LKIKNLLLVRDPWATLILSGSKTWEIRSSRLKEDKFKTVAIAKSGEKGIHRIYGVVDIVGCKGPLVLKDLQDNFEKHNDIEDTKKLPYTKTYAWVLKNPRLLKKPLDYEYKNGWVIWGVGNWEFSEDDFVDNDRLMIMSSPSKTKKERFLDSFSDDLRCFDIHFSYSSLEDGDVYTALQPDLFSMTDKDHKKYLHDSFEKIQAKNRQSEKEELERIKKKLNEKGLIASKPKEIDELNIVMRLVSTQEERNIHWYFRMLQNIPSSPSKGRNMDLIVYHVDQKSQDKHVIGIVGLGSPAYSSGSRDELFGWPKSNNKNADIKNIGLKSILQINCIMAAPPYDQPAYRLTKLLAMMVFTSDVVNGYEARYGSPLLAAISSSGFGVDAPMFHRISLGAILKYCNGDMKIDKTSRNQHQAHGFWKNPTFDKESRKNSMNSVFQREAETESVLFALASQETRKLAKEYCESSGAIKRMSAPSQAFKKALDLSGINASLLPTIRRGIYIGFLSNEYIKNLVTGNCPINYAESIVLSDLVSWWKTLEKNRLINQE
jgi:uncharacterized protein DUF4338/ASCH domain-containing protein